MVERLRERLERRYVRRDFSERDAHRPYVRADVDEVRVWAHARGKQADDVWRPRAALKQRLLDHITRVADLVHDALDQHRRVPAPHA